MLAGVQYVEVGDAIDNEYDSRVKKREALTSEFFPADLAISQRMRVRP